MAAVKYLLNCIHSADGNSSGCNMESLKDELNRLDISKFGIADLVCQIMAKMIRVFEPFVFIQKIKQKKQTGQIFEVHR